MNNRRVKITSDGTGRNTRVTDAATGEPIEAYAFEVKGSRMSAVTKAAIFCFMSEAEIETDAEVVLIHPRLRERARSIVNALYENPYTEAHAEAVAIAIGDLLGTSPIRISRRDDDVLSAHLECAERKLKAAEQLSEENRAPLIEVRATSDTMVFPPDDGSVVAHHKVIPGTQEYWGRAEGQQWHKISEREFFDFEKTTQEQSSSLSDANAQ